MPSAEAALRARFADLKDQDLKEMAAVALIRLGVKDNSFWLYLRDHVERAIRSGSPPPANPEETEEQMIQRLTTAWATAHNVSRNDAYMAVTMDNPVSVALLAQTRDPRMIPVLRDGLRSPNPFIRTQAAQWLALTQDKDSVCLIIDALLREDSPDIKILMAEGLAYSYDPGAAAVAAQYLSKDKLDAYHNERNKKCRVLGCPSGGSDEHGPIVDSNPASTQH